MDHGSAQKMGAHLNLEKPLLAEPATSCSVFSVWLENYHSLYGIESISHGSQEVWKLPLVTWRWDMLLHRRVLYHLKHHQHHIQLALPQITIGGMVCPCDVFDLYPKVFEEYLVKKGWLHSKRIYIKYPET